MTAATLTRSTTSRWHGPTTLRWRTRKQLDAAWDHYISGGGRHPRHVGRFYAHCRCGRFKTRPSSICSHCGDDPVTHNGSPELFDRERDWPYW